MNRRVVPAIAALVFFAVIGAVSLGDRAPGATQALWRRVRSIGHEVEVRFNADLIDRSDVPFSYDAIGHFGLYFVAAILTYITLRGRLGVITIIVLVIGFSGAMEVAQPLLSSSRNMQASDFIANTFGVLVGVGVAAIGTRVFSFATSRRALG